MLARRILIATDGSDHSIRALEHAQFLVHEHGLKVALIHVIAEGDGHLQSLDDEGQGPEDPEQRGARILSDACHILGVGEDDVERLMTRGDPAQELVKAAKRFQADLIIMGSRGEAGWKGSPMGSVSQAIVRESPCSVLVVKELVDHSYGAG